MPHVVRSVVPMGGRAIFMVMHVRAIHLNRLRSVKVHSARAVGRGGGPGWVGGLGSRKGPA